MITQPDGVSLWRRHFGSSGSGSSSPGRRILTEGDPGYEVARPVYNRYHDLRPAVLVQTLDRSFLGEVIDFATRHGMPLAIRGGGHHIGGFGTCAGGIVLDLSPFRNVQTEAPALVRVGPGARLSDVDTALWKEGRVLPLGTVSQTGIAGLTLGGGIGWLIGQHGLTCDNLVGGDVLLPSGDLVRAEDPEHADLLWALRGGGGLGVVLEFRYRTHGARSFRAGSAMVPMSAVADVFPRLVDFLDARCPPHLTVCPVVSASRGRAATMAVDFCSWGDDHRAVGALLEIVDPARVDDDHPDYPGWQRASDEKFLPPQRGYWKSRYGMGRPDPDIGAILEAVRAPVGSVSVALEHLHGAFGDTTIETSAFPLRACRFGWLISCRWGDAGDDDRCIEWVRNLYRAIDPLDAAPAYSNYASHDDHRPAALSIRPGSARLMAAKRRYDPENRLSINPLWRHSR